MIDAVPTDEQLDWLVFWSWSFAKRYCMALLEVAVGACDPGLPDILYQFES